MVLSRRLALLLLAGGVFQWLVWPGFLRVVVRDERAFDPGPTAFFWVHAALTAGSLALGTALLVLGWRAYRAAPGRDADGPPPTSGERPGAVRQGQRR